MPADGGSPVAGPTLTEQQRRALTARGVSVALSAGAGCGKTFVLTERFLAELEPGDADGPTRPRLSQLVAITFTERAAREMRDRIRKACGERLLTCPEQHAAHWLELIRELDSARMSTIHAFCASLLRAHAVEAGIDPRFRVLDGAQAGALLFELLDDELRNRLADRDEATLGLLVRFGLTRLREMIARLLGERQAIDWQQWRNETPAGLVARWQEYWRTDALPRALGKIAKSEAASTVLDLATRYPPAHPVMRARCEFLREQLPHLADPSKRPIMACGAGVSPARAAGTAAPQSRDALAGRELTVSEDFAAWLKDIREAAKVQGGGTKKDWVSEDVYGKFRDAASELRGEIDGFLKRAAFDPEAALPAAEAALQLLAVAMAADANYEAKKRELGVLDFNDLLIRARNLLAGPEHQALRKRLAAHIRLLLVDEFQDTDPLQVELVKALCDNEHLRGKLFFVGDKKQSIYRFRGADPGVFRQLRDEVPEDGRLPLSLNFRSQPAVLEFVNTLFAAALGPDYEPLRPHRPQVSPTPAVEFLWAVPNGNTENADGPEAADSDDDMGPRERLRRREADWIARRIRAMLDAGEKIVCEKAKTIRPEDKDAFAARQGGTSLSEAKGVVCPSPTPFASLRDVPPNESTYLDATPEFTARAVKPGDIAILFRALTNVEYYQDALQRYGIDYYLVGGRAFYSQQEVFDLLNLLRTLDTPCDDVSLIGALRSPFFGLFDETLFWLLQHPGGLAAGMFAAKLPTQLDDPQRRRAEFAAATLRDLRAMKDRLPIAQLIHEALGRTGYDALLLTEFLGERKLANLYKLIDQARSFDRAGIFTLADFTTQLAEFVARQPDEALAATHPETSNVVKLMSIHQSKGLEFPVVIVPDVDRPRMPSGPSVAFTPSLGPMFKEKDATTGYDFYLAAETDEELAEYHRLLYVAATRAADYLILSAGSEDLGKRKGPWLELIGRRFDLLKGTPRETATNGPQTAIGGGGPALDFEAGSRVRVTATPPAIGSKPDDLRLRRNLLKMVEKAQQMAADGSGKRPRYLAPVPHDPAARRQFSFSRLTGGLHAPATPLDADSPDGDTPLDPRGLGTLVHAVLAEIDFARPEDVEEAVGRHAPQHLPEAEERLDEPIEMLRRFVSSPRAAEIAAAAEVHTEIEFLLAWPPDNGPSVGRYLQGFVDCLYRVADGKWRLIDYKTNRVSPERIAEEAAKYEMQMLVYGLAVERILGCPPAELTLCFLRPGLEHRFTWGAAARRRAVELVDAALP